MKIGIITFHKAINYGAVLQTYALQKAIEKLNVQCDVIDYRCEKIEKVYKVIDVNELTNPKYLIGTLVNFPIRIIKKIKFKKFETDKIKLSRRLISKEDLKQINNEYKTFITGSDQVWNLSSTGNDKSYFLDFVEDVNKKNSYAASFGISNLPVDERETYKGLLNEFNNISVRERQGAEIVKDLTDKSASVHLDPTLLLTKEEWVSLCGKNYSGNYVLVYLMAHSESIVKFADNLAKKMNCEIIHISSTFIKKGSGKYVRTADPKEFLSLFAGAKFVVTNSFHGTVFSINFNKNVFVELLPPPATVNSRLENIMDLFDLRCRQIIDGQNNNIDIAIDYNKVNKILEQERRKSIEYLKGIIEEDNE